ncbi:MAG: sigma-70 family RNA polymerase sigma factor [Actinobacteria bacterium]|nr:sigma-70 family RNA polymerase sigma factor [Actinomycetota bacterium]
MAASDPTDALDRELVRRLADGDRDAFRELFRRYAPTALAVARRVIRHARLAEEAVQEGFLALWGDPRRYDPARGSVRAWLMSAVHHRAVDLVRREEAQRRRATEAPPDPAPTDPGTTVVEEAGLREERAAVRAALEDLPPEQRRVIELMYYGGRSQSQIAGDLGLPLGTVKSRTLLGMRRLRAALGGMER